MTPPKSKSEMKRLAVQSPFGPLEFKAEDFDKTRCLFNRMSDFAWKGVTAVLRDEANRLLAERLIPVLEVLKAYATIGARLDEIDIQRIDVNCLCDEGAAALELLNKLERK